MLRPRATASGEVASGESRRVASTPLAHAPRRATTRACASPSAAACSDAASGGGCGADGGSGGCT
eukprot:scaffold12138_cov45-Phaeocystis_antarctica.AAC.3